MPENLDPDPNKITFHYLKSSQFRVVHTDGVIGGITPSGDLHIAFFSQRTAIPQRVVMRTTPDGLGAEIPEEGFSRGGIVRELEVDAVLSLATAKLVRDFMSTHISNLELALSAAAQQPKAPE